jgi:hypothetical protein
LPCIDAIPAELIHEKGETCFEITNLFNSIWNKEELPWPLKESIIAPVYKEGDETDSSICRGISLL